MEGMECPGDCPLRTAYTRSEEDEPLAPEAIGDISQWPVASKLYSQIKHWQTRILILRETADPEEIAGDLVVVDLTFNNGVVLHESQEKKNLVAISYTWGAPVFNRKLTVNGMVYPITENLYSFLRRYRQDGDAASRLWIDAICINQHDAAEKAVQVSNMLTIYKKAQKVVVWLGEHAEHTRYAMDYLRWWEWNHWHHSPACEPNLTTLLEGLQDLCNRLWVLRVWVRQEVWAAKAISVFCGSTRGTWNDFKHGVEAVELIRAQLKDATPSAPEEAADQGSSLEEDDDAEQPMPLEYLTRRQPGELAEPADDEPRFPWIGHRSDDLLAVVKRASNCLSTDSRDRIYALLGMSRTKQRMDLRTAEDDADDLDLRVDYTRPVSLVYQDLARYVMRREQCVSAVLCLKGRFGDAGDTPSLPSWTPDWQFAASYEPHVYFDFSIRGEKEELHVYSSDSSEDGDSDVDDEQSVVSKTSDTTKADGSLGLTSELGIPIISWQGELENDTGVLQLTGVVLAELDADLPQDTNEWAPVLKYKGKSMFAARDSSD
ncbi:hypothetical protein LTR36_009347 [Oleoguttula mirabilis]|uniref:Heterokaryon incompatibility domain-containing protein n=1 Tax=Oleoguttula mirabilis TaxID=1507867 RepID=A0AAV9JRZ0_9PEZI|nr:hypothetical protein LTR36_009347 [Oleoguttula mirabilis]